MFQSRGLQFRGCRILRAIAASGAVTLLAAGCSPPSGVPPQGSGTSPSAGTPADSSRHEHGGQEGHGAHGTAARPATLHIVATPSVPAAGTPVELAMHVMGADGKPVKAFDELHEKLAHLIVVRDGLDEFAHLHPDVGQDGTLRTQHQFAKGGKYRLFVDYQPSGGSPSLATGELSVAGEETPAPELTPNADQTIEAGDLKAKVELVSKATGTTIRFRIVDAEGKPVSDLQPYLGAMGHLVVIKSKSLDYVHAHPVSEAKQAPDGVVEFEAHLPSAGIFKAWGQFRRHDQVLTFPVVMKIDTAAAPSGGHNH